VLQLQCPFELFGFDDGVDAEFAAVAVVGVLQGAFAVLEHPPCAAVHERGCGREHQLDGRFVLVG
jgi:hypothetical protein